MQDDGGVPLRPRERIISTARDLFRKHGIRGVGVDAIAEAAGTRAREAFAPAMRDGFLIVPRLATHEDQESP